METTFIHCGQCRFICLGLLCISAQWRKNLHTLFSLQVSIFSLVMNNWDIGETAFKHSSQCGFICLGLL